MKDQTIEAQAVYLFHTEDLALLVEDAKAGRIGDLAEYIEARVFTGALRVDDADGQPVAVLTVRPSWLVRQRDGFN